jgi:acetylornithine deacetylase
LALTWPPEIELLRELVATPSVSGDEEAVARLVESAARANGLAVTRDEFSVTVTVAGKSPGPTLAMISHLDVVPPGEGWTRDPFRPSLEGNRLYGRGSGDAKASVAAMVGAAEDLVEGGGPARGRLLVILGYGEETKHTTMPKAVARAGTIDAAVVGEPTNLNFAIAQRGLMMVDLVAHGDQRHAGYAGDEGQFANAITELARDLTRLGTLFEGRKHPILGLTTVTPTMIEGGIGRNITPPVAQAILDVRSTPSWTHAELAEEMRRVLGSEVRVASDRLIPCETPPGSRLLELATNIRPESKRFGSPTCSDWVFVHQCDAFKCGPGTSRRSHTPDEYVDLHEVSEARTFFRQLAERYLA